MWFVRSRCCLDLPSHPYRLETGDIANGSSYYRDFLSSLPTSLFKQKFSLSIHDGYTNEPYNTVYIQTRLHQQWPRYDYPRRSARLLHLSAAALTSATNIARTSQFDQSLSRVCANESSTSPDELIPEMPVRIRPCRHMFGRTFLIT